MKFVFNLISHYLNSVYWNKCVCDTKRQFIILAGGEKWLAGGFFRLPAPLASGSNCSFQTLLTALWYYFLNCKYVLTCKFYLCTVIRPGEYIVRSCYIIKPSQNHFLSVVDRWFDKPLNCWKQVMHLEIFCAFTPNMFGLLQTNLCAFAHLAWFCLCCESKAHQFCNLLTKYMWFFFCITSEVKINPSVDNGTCQGTIRESDLYNYARLVTMVTYMLFSSIVREFSLISEKVKRS